METKKKEKKYFLGIIGGLILGLLFCALIVSLYIFTDFIALLGMIVFLGVFEYLGYKLLRGKIDKKLPGIIAILSSINVIIMAFLFIPTALLVKSNIQIGFKEIGGLYSQFSISLNILQDFLLSLVFALFGSYALGTVVKRKIMLRVNKIKLFSSDNKEKQELKEEAINVVKDIFKRLNAVEKEKSVKKEEQKLFKELKKQSLGLDIEDFSFRDHTTIDQEAGNRRKHLAEENRKNGKSDIYGYYQIPYQTMIDEHIVTMSIRVSDTENTSKKDLEEATTKLDASKLPDGEYEFYFFTTDKDNSANYDNSGYISYTFNIQDGKVVQDDDD